jgi:hypothetical protein
LLKFDQFRDAHPDPTTAEKQVFLEVLTQKFKEVLDYKNRRDVAISLMEEEEITAADGNKKTGVLVVTFLPDKSPLDKTIRLAIGEGGAGVAYQKKVPIYIPSVKHLIGINVSTRKSEGITFKKSGKAKKFRSILCAPVLEGTTMDVIAVLTFSSQKRSAFYPEDFDLASLAAVFVSLFY